MVGRFKRLQQEIQQFVVLFTAPVCMSRTMRILSAFTSFTSMMVGTAYSDNIFTRLPRASQVKNIITVSGADHHDVNEVNAALVTFRYVLRLEWRESLSKLTFANFLLEALLFLPHVYRMVNYFSEFFQTCVRNC